MSHESLRFVYSVTTDEGEIERHLTYERDTYAVTWREIMVEFVQFMETAGWSIGGSYLAFEEAIEAFEEEVRSGKRS